MQQLRRRLRRIVNGLDRHQLELVTAFVVELFDLKGE